MVTGTLTLSPKIPVADPAVRKLGLRIVIAPSLRTGTIEAPPITTTDTTAGVPRVLHRARA
jgi:hypothetical protein